LKAAITADLLFEIIRETSFLKKIITITALMLPIIVPESIIINSSIRFMELMKFVPGH